MSRRTRRLIPVSIITVILLGLVLALAFYAIMWLPVNPLRFHPIAYLEDDMVPVGYAKDGRKLFHMAVENTSNSTVYLLGADVSGTDPSSKDKDRGIAYLSYYEQTIPGMHAARRAPIAAYGTSIDMIIIPPRRTVHCIATALFRRQAELATGMASAEYEWTSDGRDRLMEAWNFVRFHLPTKLEPHLRVSEMRNDVIPLEFPPPVPEAGK